VPIEEEEEEEEEEDEEEEEEEDDEEEEEEDKKKYTTVLSAGSCGACASRPRSCWENVHIIRIRSIDIWY
jgi:hypothetical protein